MKKAILIIVAILLCVSAFGCVESQRVQDTFQGSAEGKMIGKTFQDIEAEFGPFSMVYLDAEWTPMYLFTKTNVGFYFNDVGTPDSWAAMLKNGTTFIPAAVALQTVRGAAALLAARGTHPEAEIDRVTTPGGITIKGLNAMEEAGFSAAVIAGLKAWKPKQ